MTTATSKLYVILYEDEHTKNKLLPFFWTGNGWAHSVAEAMRFSTPAAAQIERWNAAGTDSVIGWLG